MMMVGYGKKYPTKSIAFEFICMCTGIIWSPVSTLTEHTIP